MTDTENQGQQPAKPSRLSGLVAPKGIAARPGESLQATPLPTSIPRPEPTHTPLVAAASTGTGSKSLTLRLPDAEYERLRSHAFVSRKTHQTILAEALRQYLDKA